ncbi:tetratricopeptide repeat protein [Muriicola sp. Z0-33]|uniref:tetratricopeptide repeat protein n=1 Tax=Muriicola sp. Z0-33 TaxID=2816957 RepID=UPI0022385BFF|nr:tetratricopeptide repeat protein [Muriicola sp. Z0-33]MCW5515335.1 tetratricopeptide repeat protein [Muriicola sp. Z0-33]
MNLKVIVCCLYCLLAFHNGTAQLNFDIDSLLLAYEKHDLDTLKVMTNNNIINYYMYRNPELAKKYAFEQLEISNQIEFSGGQSMANYQLGILYNNVNNVDSARYHYSESLKYAKIYNNHIFVSQAYHGLALIEFELGNLDKADEINDKNLEFNYQNKDSVGVAYSLDFKGRINENRGHYTIALENVLKSLKLLPVVSTPINRDVRIADAKTHLAAIEHSIGNYQKAIAYNLEALEIYINQNDTYYQAVAEADLAKSYTALKQFNKAEAALVKSIEKSKIANVPSTEASALAQMGALFNLQAKPKLGAEFLQKSISLAKEINSERRIAISRLELAESYILLNRLEDALGQLSDVFAYATGDGNGNLSILRDAYLKRSTIHKKNNKPGASLENYQKYKHLNDSIFNIDRTRKLEELKIIYETEKKEAALALQEEEIMTLNEKAKVDQLTKGLYAGGTGAGILISGLLFFGFRQRIKKNKIAREKQEEIYRQEIEYKKKELASQTLHLVQKNTFIQELMDNLQNIKNDPDRFKVEFRRIVMLLKKENASDKDWEVFKSYFAEVHNDFDQKLKTLYKDISEKEIRLAAFLRMNLTTKEIAATLNVLPDSILKSKYRLKKKLRLDKSQDLSSFLSAL